MSEADLIPTFRDRQKELRFGFRGYFSFPFQVVSALAACFSRAGTGGSLVLPSAQAPSGLCSQEEEAVMRLSSCLIPFYCTSLL